MGRNCDRRRGKTTLLESEGEQEHEMGNEQSWGRIRRMKQERLPTTVNDHCGERSPEDEPRVRGQVVQFDG